jgi:hypothetical protein
MPPIKDATKRPTNLGEVIQPATPTAQNPPPIIPREQPGFGPASLGPAPALWTTDFDRVRQWVRPGTSQGRFPVLPTKANPQPNASASSVSAKKIAPVQSQVTSNTGAIAALKQVTFQGAWQSSVTYFAGAQVDFGGTIYVSLQSSNLGNQPDTSPTFWVSTGGTSTFEGTWNSGTSYVDGNSVLYTNAGVTAFYVAIAPSTNKIPSSSPTFWQVTGSSSNYVFLGAWSSGTTYFPGNQVIYNPSGGGSIFWICISQTTGNAPTQASSFWELVGTSAANLSGLDGVKFTSTSLNLVYNGDFSIATVPTGLQSVTASAIRVQDLQSGGGIQPSCNGWTRNFESGGNGEGVIYQIPTTPSVGLVGPFSLVIQDRTSSTGDLFAAVSDAFSVRQNTPYTFSANLNVGLGGGGGIPAHAAWYFRVLWYSVGATDFSRSSASLISFNDVVSASTASGAQSPSAIFTSPANAGFCRIAFYHYNDGVSNPATGWNLVVSNVRCVSPIDPSNLGQVLAKGSTPATLNLGFSYSSTTTSITWTWTGISILRADGSTTAVTNGSQTITGLSASSTYSFYPYASDTLDGGTTVRWVTQTTGSPQYAGVIGGSLASAQVQNLQTNIPLSTSSMQASTPSSGSSGGTGGGSGGCLHEDMLVTKKTEDGPLKVRIGDILVGDYIWTPTGWGLVTNVRHRPCSTWLLIQTDVDSVLVTPSHPFTLATEDTARAEKLSFSDFLQGTKERVAAIQSISVVHRPGTKVSITVEPNHVFYAGLNAELLVHNGNTRS